MEYKRLSETKLKVSNICLGTMTWGEQNSEADAHEQLDYATSKGINFIDTAEFYSIPGREETQGSTERIIGNWLKKRGKRVDVILASKVTGPGDHVRYIRNGPNYNRNQILKALNGSLKRLQTDYLDLYQLHWPERNTNYFGKLNYEHDYNDPWQNNFLDILHTMGDLVKEGKIRHFGLSNETPWGLMQMLYLADKYNLPKPVSIQNPYSLLNRSFEVGLAEICIRENIAVLPYSPLAFGMLTGKYLNGKKPENARLTLYENMKRYTGQRSFEATEEYKKIAEKHGLSLTHLALTFVNTRPFVTSNIIGATNLNQLKENIESAHLKLSEEVIADIENIHDKYPFPAP